MIAMNLAGTPRRSSRSVKIRRSYSPELVRPALTKNTRKTTKTSSGRSKETKSTKEAFFCDLCKSSFVLHRRKPDDPQNCRQPKTKQISTLCNACGLAMKQKPRRRKARPPPMPEEKEKYMRDACLFARSLVETLKDPDAERLYCPEFKLQPCACLQRYIVGGGDWTELTKRAQSLLYLLKEAKTLSRQKYYKIDEVILMNKNRKGKRLRHIGLGNGQKRSRAFEEFVLMQRKHLREELGICERATQKVLMYSNNFLHKRLKTEPEKNQRVERKKGKAVMGLLRPIEELVMESCCEGNCVLMASTHAVLLKCWRDRATLGQAETRRVLAEMLTPSAGRKQNCYKFIALVTGCSNSTISRVSEQMQRTGGDREPPEHGLKRFWQEQAKKLTAKEKCNLDSVCQVVNPLSYQTCNESDSSSSSESLSENATETSRHSTCLMENATPKEVPTSSSERFAEFHQQAYLMQHEKDGSLQKHFATTSVTASEQVLESRQENTTFEIPVEQNSGTEAMLTRLESLCPADGSVPSSLAPNRSLTDYTNTNLIQQPLHQIFVSGETVTLQVVNSGLESLLLIHDVEKDGSIALDKNALASSKDPPPVNADTEVNDCHSTEPLMLNVQKQNAMPSYLLMPHPPVNNAITPVSEGTCPLPAITGEVSVPDGLEPSLI